MSWMELICYDLYLSLQWTSQRILCVTVKPVSVKVTFRVTLVCVWCSFTSSFVCLFGKKQLRYRIVRATYTVPY